MADANDAVENVQRFNAVLAETSTGLDAQHVGLEGRSESIAQDAQAAEDRLGAFQSALEQGVQEIEQATAAAEDAVEALGTSAAAAADTRLAAADGRLEQAGDLLERGLDTAREQVQQHSSELDAQGFQPADTALETMDAAADRLKGEGDTAAGELEQAISDAQQEMESTRAEDTQAVDAFVSDTGGHTDGIEKLLSLTTFFNDTFVSRIHAGAEQFKGGIEQAYSTFTSATEQVEDATLTETSGALSETERHVEEKGIGPVEGATESANGVLGTLLQAAQESETTLGGLSAVAASAAGVAQELPQAQRLAAELQRVVNSMDGV
jgi:hypothetical protein